MSGDMIIWSPGVTLDEIERQVIEKSFQFFKCNKSATARALGITVKTLDNKFERYRDDDARAEAAKKLADEQREFLLQRARFGTGAGIQNPLQSVEPAAPAPFAEPPVPPRRRRPGEP